MAGGQLGERREGLGAAKASSCLRRSVREWLEKGHLSLSSLMQARRQARARGPVWGPGQSRAEDPGLFMKPHPNPLPAIHFLEGTTD